MSEQIDPLVVPALAALVNDARKRLSKLEAAGVLPTPEPKQRGLQERQPGPGPVGGCNCGDTLLPDWHWNSCRFTQPNGPLIQQRTWNRA